MVMSLRQLLPLIAAILLGGFGCENQPGGAKAVDLPPKRAADPAGERPSTPSRSDPRGRREPTAGPRPGSTPGVTGVATPRAIDQQGPPWAIVLGTFSGEDHETAARDACEKLGERIPELRGAVVKSTPRGSMILWGSYAGPEDPAARKEVERMKAYEYKGARPFASAMLVRPEVTRKPPSGPNDLRNLRRRFPKTDPLYTLQVAAWADFDGTKKLEEIRRSAEAHAAQLRAKGYEAWFNHDDDLKMSVVTVGAFGNDAYDPRSTLYSREVSDVLKKFPQHLVNGEPLLIRTDPKNPRSAEFPQQAYLVQVPR